MKGAATTHEAFLHAVREVLIARAHKTGSITPAECERIAHTKLIYGMGRPGVRGVCYFQQWENGVGTVDVVEMAAATEENWVQLLGTEVHELAHVLAGPLAGHGPVWKDYGQRLGFRLAPEAAGQQYRLAQFPTELREQAHRLAQFVADGKPARWAAGWLSTAGTATVRPCSAGVGTRGGTSRGKGAGSRYRLWACPCGTKVRAATDDLQATCTRCGGAFSRAG